MDPSRYNRLPGRTSSVHAVIRPTVCGAINCEGIHPAHEAASSLRPLAAPTRRTPRGPRCADCNTSCHSQPMHPVPCSPHVRRPHSPWLPTRPLQSMRVPLMRSPPSDPSCGRRVKWLMIPSSLECANHAASAQGDADVPRVVEWMGECGPGRRPPGRPTRYRPISAPSKPHHRRLVHPPAPIARRSVRHTLPALWHTPSVADAGGRRWPLDSPRRQGVGSLRWA